MPCSSIRRAPRMMLLAPAISERKGEHAELIEELQAGGFVRARIDGEVVELDQAPKLDVRRKHTVEAIVDRFKVRPDLGQRLAESFETALAARIGRGARRVHGRPEPRRTGVLQQVCLPDLQLLAEPSSSRGCSRSTAPSAPARAATGSARRSSSIPRRSSPIRICRSPAARCAAGTGAMPTISS